MIQWIQKSDWLPEIYLACVLLIAGLLPDTINQGWQGALAAAAFVIGIIFLRKFEYLALVLSAVSAAVSIWFSLDPLITGVLTLLGVFFISAFGRLLWSALYTASAFLAGIVVIAHTCFDSPLLENIYGLAIFSDIGRWSAFIIISLVTLVILTLAWLVGNWFIVQHKERLLQRERSAIDEKQIRLAIDLAEQNERMGIARDLNLVTTQQLSASIALIEGARYASKIDAEVATRTLERVEGLLRETHTELQQQQDALSHGVSIAPAPPNIFDLDALMIQYREIGYNCTLKHQGEQHALIDSAELAIYRIVFDALGNIRKHAVIGTDITVDLTWQDGGLQLLIKDNGTETARKVDNHTGAGDYNVNDDLEALVSEVDGVGIRTMRERAEIIGGSLEAKVVPGVGFTVNALFPNLQTILKG
ncbi:MAG: ATP-binding protein [Micrococcales bacterium]